MPAPLTIRLHPEDDVVIARASGTFRVVSKKQ